MKRQDGFSLVELMVAVSIVVLILAATLSTLTSALNATQAITLMADTQENLRAGLNYMVRDILQAGEGVPQGGITIPNTAGVSALNRPGPGTPEVSFGTFSTTWTALPAVIPGYELGATTSTSGVATDMVTVMYADTTLQDTNGHWLNEFPIYLKPGGSGTTGCAASNPNPAPAGSITTTGSTTTVTFDSSCIIINNGNTGINPGDLILMQNNNTLGDGSQVGTDSSVSDSTGSMALLCVSAVNPVANSLTFSVNDPFDLNASGLTSGTIKQIQTPAGSGTYPTTTASRFWLITYYISTSAPASAAQPMLMRQVNMNQPEPVGEVIENMQIFYDILNAGSSPVTVTAAQEQPTSAQLDDIRDAYIMLYARSQDKFNHTNQYFRNNLETVVSIRGLDFYNQFQ